MTKRKISICFIITGLGTGGAEKMLFNLLCNIDKNVFNLTVISLTKLDTFKEKIERIGVEVIALDMKLNIFFFCELRKLFFLIKNIKPDIVHTWMYHADLIGGVVSKLLGVKRIIWSLRQTNFPKNYDNYPTLFVVKLSAYFSYFIPNKILSCSRRGIITHSSLGYNKDKFIYIPNGFSLDIFKQNLTVRLKMRNLFGIASDVPVVGIIGRYDRQKNYLGFIASANKILAEFRNLKFVFVGKNVDYNNNELIAELKKFNLNDMVKLLGERSDISDVIQSFDVLTLPSSYGEGFPNVLGEAMACCVPCVATDVGDSCEIIGDTGYIVPVDDMDGLTSCIIKILRKKLVDKETIGLQARERIIHNFEIKNVTRQYEDLYINCMREF